MPEWKVGDIVSLKSHHEVLMTVSIAPRPMRGAVGVECAWFDKNSVLQVSDFNVEVLYYWEDLNG